MNELRAHASETDEPLREVTRFGLFIGGVSLSINAYGLWRWGAVNRFWLLAGGLFIIAGLVAPKLLKPFYRLWMMMSLFLGQIMTRVILFLFFFLVLTPLAVVLRMFGKQFLDLRFKIKNAATTYWQYRDIRRSSKERLEQQF